MKHVLIFTVGICLLISMPAMAGQAEDEAAIRDLVKQINAAYNNEDAQAISTLLVEDIETWSGESKGRRQVSESWANQKLQCKQLDEIGLIFVTPDTAIIKVRNEYTDADSKREVLLAWVLVKEDGKWLFAAVFNRRIEQ